MDIFCLKGDYKIVWDRTIIKNKLWWIKFLDRKKKLIKNNFLHAESIY